MRKTLLPTLLVAMAPLPAAAKDLNGRFGVGFSQSFNGTTALSLRYGLPLNDPAVNVQLEGFGGFDFNNQGSNRLVVGGRALYGVVVEDNMNLYAAAGAGILTSQADNTSSIRLQPAMGAEFFLFGLENLGFMTEWGLNVDLGSDTGLSTTANAGIGVHYWF